MVTTADDAKVHPFERAGLGVAPFRFVRVEIRVGPIDMGNGLTVGAPGQPMGCCAYCANGIKECCIIRGADGKEFVVGNVCVRKTADKALVSATERAVREHKRKAGHARDDARIAAALEAMPTVRAALAAKPHPMHGAKGDYFESQTLADWCDWMLARGGRAGKMRAARVIERSAETH